MSVILRTEQGAVSLLVDRIGDVREVQRELFEPPPVTLRDLARDMIRGVYKLHGAEHTVNAPAAVDVQVLGRKPGRRNREQLRPKPFAVFPGPKRLAFGAEQ